MNALVIFAEDLKAELSIRIEGERVQKFLSEQTLKCGQSIRLSILNDSIRTAVVLNFGNDWIDVALDAKLPVPERLPLTLFVAVPRPQTVKKVISLAVQVGIEALYFVKSYHTVPSYLQSHSLYPENMQSEAIKALEQVWDCYSPKITVVEKMASFYETVLPQIIRERSPSHLILGEPYSANTQQVSQVLDAPAHVVLGIGPEKGWSPSELEGFANHGFVLSHLDKREYRVETALALFLGQIKAVFD